MPQERLARRTDAAVASEPKPAQLPMNQQRAIDAAARNKLRAFGGREPIPGVFIAIYMPGYAPYVRSVGYANVPSKKPFRLPDKFRIGSNMKTFVVTVLLQRPNASSHFPAPQMRSCATLPESLLPRT